MRIEVHGSGDGVQFVVKAEGTMDQLVLKQFSKQVREDKFWLHGTTYCSGSVEDGPTSFNFGTVKNGSVTDKPVLE